jgi:ketosteroid isomerase-like protein
VHPNAATIETFYTCFGRRDAEGMVACYAPDVEFSDPVFPSLKGEEAFAMWRMLAERAADLRIEASGITADDASGRAHWDAYYTFSATGNKVLNRIDATFVFRHGKIVRHQDRFDLRTWAAQALGLKGKLLGWLPPVQSAIRAQADQGLRAYIASTAHGARPRSGRAE